MEATIRSPKDRCSAPQHLVLCSTYTPHRQEYGALVTWPADAMLRCRTATCLPPKSRFATLPTACHWAGTPHCSFCREGGVYVDVGPHQVGCYWGYFGGALAIVGGGILF